MSLVFEHVSYRYPNGTQGLDDVSFEIRRGELLAVIGPSGSGKSTLLNLVSGLAFGHSGRILLNGKDIATIPIHRRNIGMVFQSYALFPHLDVLDNVAYGLKLRKVDLATRREQARRLLELVGLGDRTHHSVSQLSGGQQQRVALARALAIDPSALLLDEPLSALDASVRGHLRDQIRQIQQRFGATTLLVTHDQEEALTMADRVAVLQQGKLLQIGTPREIYERPATRAVASFVGLSTIFPATVVARDKINVGFAQWTTPTADRQVGAAVHALVRPEHVEPDPPEGALNRTLGRTATLRYFGALTRYDFLAEGATQPLLAESPVPARQAVAVSPARILLLNS